MKAEKYRQLNKVHLLHRIWQTDLELALQEVTFWEDLLNKLNEEEDLLGKVNEETSKEQMTWRAEVGRLHHFNRLVKRLLDEIKSLNVDVAYGVKTDQPLDKETRENHQYLREELDSFHADFRAFKAEIRSHLVAQPTF